MPTIKFRIGAQRHFPNRAGQLRPQQGDNTPLDSFSRERISRDLPGVGYDVDVWTD
ncbi:hypothetical protein L0337_44330 [candidate division KSB1 bacterium]|nr:hypothetical protein [candidate division KSB1 bacterium]